MLPHRFPARSGRWWWPLPCGAVLGVQVPSFGRKENMRKTGYLGRVAGAKLGGRARQRLSPNPAGRPGAGSGHVLDFIFR